MSVHPVVSSVPSVSFPRRSFLRSATLVALSCGLPLATRPALAQIANDAEAVNKAGRQRMLSQRMAKCYFQIGLQVQNQRSQRLLQISAATFGQQLDDLKAYAPTPEIKDLYLRLEKKWDVYQKLLTAKAPDPATARQVLAMSDDVLALAHQGTVALEKHTGGAVAGLVNISGRQRMLSQRIAKFHQAMEYKVADDGTAQEIQKARAEFIQGMAVLKAAPQNTREIKTELELADMQWAFFDQEIQSMASTHMPTQPVNVATTSERILEVMDRITGLYERLPH